MSLILIIATMSLAAGPAKTPPSLEFWEKSPKIWKEIRDERRLLVSAGNADGRTHTQGVGLVDAPVDRVWAFATNPEKVKTASRFIKSFTWNKDTGDIVMKIEVMMFSYVLKGRATRHPHPDGPKVSLEVFEGELVPFTAELEIRSAALQSARDPVTEFPEGKSLVRIAGTSSPDRALSWPLRVALEAVMQRAAGSLREAVENESPPGPPRLD